MPRDPQKSKSRELEIARRFRQIIDGLPNIALNNLVANLVEVSGLGAQPVAAGEAVTISRSWTTTTAAERLQFQSHPEVAVEVVPSGRTVDRFDLVVPIPIVRLFGNSVTCLIFEFKLGRRDCAQLKRYCELAPNALVISVSMDPNGDEPIERPKEGGRPWIHQTWEHVYFALQSLLSGDATPRIARIDEPGDLLLNFDHRVAGQDRLAFAIESFLSLIVERNLLPNRTLTLVIPVGGNAASSLQHGPPYYAHSDSWQSGYRFLVAIRGNEIQAVYSVEESVSTERIDGVGPPCPSGLDKELWARLCRDEVLRVSVLKDVSQEHVSILGARFREKGPTGRTKTFTQTHRYLASLDELSRYFSA